LQHSGLLFGKRMAKLFCRYAVRQITVHDRTNLLIDLLFARGRIRRQRSQANLLGRAKTETRGHFERTFHRNIANLLLFSEPLAYRSVKNIANELRPGVLDELGLV
jgi:hypothetical protein